MKDPATVALCVGHSRRMPAGNTEGGAVTHDGTTTEWQYNTILARMIAAELYDTHGIQAFLINDYGPRSYGEAMAWLARELRDLGNIRLAVELHFNAATPEAHGHEWLHWHSSKAGKLLATQLHLAMMRNVPGIKARGVKPKTSSDRGAEFLRRTHCPAVICEPFFGSHPNDWRIGRQHQAAIARAIAAGIAASH